MGATKNFRLFRKKNGAGGTKDWAIADDGELYFGKTGSRLQSRKVDANTVIDRILQKEREGYRAEGRRVSIIQGYAQPWAEEPLQMTEQTQKSFRPIQGEYITWRLLRRGTSLDMDAAVSRVLTHINTMKPSFMNDLEVEGALLIEKSTTACLIFLHVLTLKKNLPSNLDLEISDPSGERSLSCDPRKEGEILAMFGVSDFEEIRFASEALGLVLKPLVIEVPESEPCYDY